MKIHWLLIVSLFFSLLYIHYEILSMLFIWVHMHKQERERERERRRIKKRWKMRMNVPLSTNLWVMPRDTFVRNRWSLWKGYLVVCGEWWEERCVCRHAERPHVHRRRVSARAVQHFGRCAHTWLIDWLVMFVFDDSDDDWLIVYDNVVGWLIDWLLNEL